MELLAPAGHWEAMVAAVQSGADSVYMGCGGFNARRGAKNFTPEEFAAAVSYCHLRGVKVYMTLNTLLTDRELPQAEEYLRQASRWGVDAVIVQDWGLLALARAVTPELPLHGSTQMTVHSLEGVEAAAEMGMRCVVLSRELSREDAAFICRRSPIPIEVFAHGALCMCYSGQCAMSALIGQRSGNRGTCAQPCRLPYQMDGGKTGHPLSLKDACLASHLGELEEMGVSILKLEGRMKRPEYVAVITEVYARLLREKRQPTAEELSRLEQAFSRQGFTQDYWLGRPGPQMFGTRGENAPEPTELFREARSLYEKETARTVPVKLTAAFRAGAPSSLTAEDPQGRAFTAAGPVPEAARTRPLTEEDLRQRLSKTGGTVFSAETVAVSLEEGLSLPASAVNGLRREALEGLAALRSAPPERHEAPAPPMPEKAPAPEAPRFSLSLYRGEQLTEELMALSPALIYLPAEGIETFDLAPYLGRGTEFAVALPRICTDHQRDALVDLLKKSRDAGCTSAAVGNIGQVAMAREMGFSLRGDYGLNVFNSRSLAMLEEMGFVSACLSFELRHQQIRDLRGALPREALVYGRLPLMVTENCLVRNAFGCKSRDLHGPCRQSHRLTDRRGEDFPVLPVFGCRSEIQNGAVLYLADKPEYRRCGLTYARLRFTTEGPAECVRVLADYRSGGGTPPQGHTRGLFYRGVE